MLNHQGIGASSRFKNLAQIDLREQMTESLLKNLLKLRLIVSFLGEKAQFAWWPTAFYESSSRLFLEPVFSKTTRLAQYHGAIEAARRLHDEHLSVGSYHLFRLPEEVEQDLHAIMQSEVGAELISQATQCKDAALDALRCLAAASGMPREGPMVVGNIRDLDSCDTLSAVATTYLSAFSHNTKTYPYLVG